MRACPECGEWVRYVRDETDTPVGPKVAEAARCRGCGWEDEDDPWAAWDARMDEED